MATKQPRPLTDKQLNDFICWWDGAASSIPDLLQETARRTHADDLLAMLRETVRALEVHNVAKGVQQDARNAIARAKGA